MAEEVTREPYVDRPMIDQNGQVVGTSRTPLRDLLAVEVHVDEVGTCWTPPTAWAYAQACRVCDEKYPALTTAHAQAAELRAENEALRVLLDEERELSADLRLEIAALEATRP